MAGSKMWTSDDATGGPFDDVVQSVRARFPDAHVSRLFGTHPGDDDNVFWIERSGVQVQIDTCPGGAPPFIEESDLPGSRLDTAHAEVATERINHLLGGFGQD